MSKEQGMGSKIRAVVFDYGGVLMRTVNPVPRRELEQRFGLSPGGASKLVFGSPLWDETQLGRISSTEFWADVGQRLGLNAEELAEFRQAFWAGDRLDEELVALIRHLRDAGYRTALLSNAPAGLRQHLEQLGIADAFEVIVASGCEGLMKPDAAIFGGLSPLRRCLQNLGVPVPDPVLAPLPDVRAVIFDWGGVIEALPDEVHITEWERRLALEPGTLPGILWGEVWHQLEVGAITNDDFGQHVADRLGLPDTEAALRFLEAFYTGDRFNPEVATTARALRGRYKIALLTNTLPGQDDLIRERCGLDVYSEFDVYVNSAYVGLRKPDPAIFHLTLDQLGVVPQQAVFVDDSLRNVDSARELGIHTIQFVDPITSLAELEALLGHPIG
jgi:putative hydrolase of the HAD superfamily